ncbi:MAG: alanine--tRNA ligase [Clostridia bacterium]|nr:alanine--tRNA ligase [Clostridia bacterium]
MQPISLNEIRKKYLEFFESKGHLCLNSFPLVPQDDDSLLLINAGMAPLKKYFTGERVPPRKRVTTCQKCVRTLDIDNVGKTARHGTFFEMLGNFSFGDYFKEEAIPWAWEFLTKVMGIPEDRLYPSIYVEDDEAFDIWVKNGIPAERIVRFGKDDNFWEIGSGPCGPCSEIYFDRGEKYGCGKPDCKVGCDCDRFIEVWNIVFTQFDSDGNGTYTRLANPNIDTGMGLERLACVMQDVGNLFEVDTNRSILDKVCELCGKEYHGSAADNDVSIRVITDHIKTATFLIGDGVIPSNEGRGYILRRVLRRAARHGRLLGIKGTFLGDVCDVVIANNGEAYPELNERKEYIKKTIKAEEDRFAQTLDAGLSILEKMLADAEAKGEKILSGENVFKLYDTYGFPIDLTKEITEEKGIEVDEESFKALMQEQKKRAREARANIDAGWAGDALAMIDKSKATEFAGYSEAETDYQCNIEYIIANGEDVGILSGGEATIILDKTTFYAESGGQIGDTGFIETAKGLFEVTDTQKTPEGQYLHIGKVVNGTIEKGSAVAKIDVYRRNAIRRNHSALHLLQAALRKVLGTHVEQAGSYVTDKYGRFDFTHGSALTADEIQSVQNLVNAEIFKNYSVTTDIMTPDEARAKGAMALFGEKYGSSVRVVSMGDFSKELCGGTHVSATGSLGLFRIVSESSVAAGVRRIECLTGEMVLDMMQHQEKLLENVKKTVKAVSNDDITAKVEQLINESKALKKELDAINRKSASEAVDKAYESAVDVKGIKLVRASFADVTVDALRDSADKIIAKDENAVCVFSTVNEGKVLLVSACGANAVKSGAHAGNLLKAVSPIVGGGGGGRPNSASSGGKDASKIPEALAEAENVLASQIK